jgi:hypothetical protein
MEEVDGYNNVLFYTCVSGSRTLIALSYLSEDYDMVQVYKMSDYNDKSYGLLISQVGISPNPKEKYISITENAAGGIKERLEKMVWKAGSITYF